MSRRRWAAIAFASLLLLVAVQSWLALRYVTITPGWARPVASLVRVEGKESSGNLLYVAVITRRATLLDLARSRFDPLVEVRPARESFLGRRAWSEYADVMRSMMEESRAIAAAVALRGLHYRVDYESLSRGGPGDLPVAIDFAEAEVLGDSASLMMALELYSQLNPGVVASDRLIAGTGTLEPDGRIQPVDGIVQKIHSSKAAGAEVFLLPRANLEDVEMGAFPLRLIPVDTFEQALAALQRLAAEE